MKKFVVFMFWVVGMLLTSLPMSAQNDVRLTMDFKGEPLSNVLLRLEQSSPYKFLFSYSDVEKETVNGSVKDARFMDIVDYVLKGKSLKYTVDGKFITIVRTANAQHSSGRNIRTVGGYVYFADTKEPVVGAQLKIIGTNIFTVSDLNGAFHFDYLLPDDSKVQVTYVGMKTVNTVVKPDMKIMLEADTKELQGVVVTGIFQKAKESYTGAVSSIDRKQLDMYRGTNLMQTLKNIDASINFPINNVAGSNPNVLPNLNIRGSSSLPMSVEEFNTNSQQTVNAPLIILDGFEISLTKLMDYNDEQIESINILKDAAATAIYGSRGANGVIVVVTKTPKEGKLRVTAKAGLSLEIPDLGSYHLLNAGQKLQLEKIAGLYTDVTNPIQQVKLDSYYNERLKAVHEGVDTDWMSKPLRNGVGQRYNIQLDGGANEFRWGASLGYNGIEGAMKGSSRRTITGDITLMYSVKNVIFRNYTSVASNNSKESKYGSFQNYVDMQPYNAPYDAEGKLVKSFNDLTHSGTLIGNPLYDASLNTVNDSEYFEFINNFSAEWIITDGLRARAKFGVTTHRNTSDYFLPAEHSYFNNAEYRTPSGILRKGRYEYGTGRSDLLSGNLTMSYSKIFKEKHQLYVGVDYSISEEKLKNYSFVAEGFTNADLTFLGNATQYEQDGAPLGDRTTIRMVGVTGNANYTYDNRYYVDLSYRVDGSSKFGSDKRFAPFWSVGIGWNLHNEKFLKNNSIINTLRLKASYGITGSQDFTTENVYTTYKFASGDRYLNWAAANMMGLGNTHLTWQKTNELNIGMEIGLLERRVTAEVNWYTKKTGNLLSNMDLPLASGFSSYVANVGELKNHGVEASLNAYLIRDSKRGINLTIGGQLVYNWNEISKLSDAIMAQNELYLAQNVDVSNLFYVGRPMNAIYAVRSAGIDPSTGREVFLNRDGNIVKDWNSSDKVYLGPSDPLWRGNFHSMLMWRNFTFNIGFSYHWGGKLYNSTLRDRVEVTTGTIAAKNVDERVLSDRWMKPGDNTFFKGLGSGNTHATSRYVFDDNVLELSSVSAQYRWNTEWLRNNLRLESVVFALNANSLFYWSSVKYERGTSYPYARNFQGSVTLTF